MILLPAEFERLAPPLSAHPFCGYASCGVSTRCGSDRPAKSGAPPGLRSSALHGRSMADRVVRERARVRLRCRQSRQDHQPLAVIDGTSNFVKPHAAIAAILPRSGRLAALAPLLIGLETKGARSKRSTAHCLGLQRPRHRRPKTCRRSCWLRLGAACRARTRKKNPPAELDEAFCGRRTVQLGAGPKWGVEYGCRSGGSFADCVV